MKTSVNGKTIEQRASELKRNQTANATEILSNEYDLKLANAARYISQARTGSDWRSDPMTENQRSLLNTLGVDLNGKTLTKGIASQAIDSVKRGDGCGLFGLNFFDGGN
jgi:hypothetical protein